MFQSANVRDVRDIIQNRARSTMEDVMDDAMIKKNRIQGIRFTYEVKILLWRLYGGWRRVTRG